MINVFILTYNEYDLFVKTYTDDYINNEIKPNNINFIILDNGKQDRMKDWANRNGFIYYASEYNIGSSGGYNWIFKLSYMMGLDMAILMQADVELSSAEPILLIENLVKKYGDNSFICWPQELFNHWSNDPEKIKPYDHNISNLGNLVGFNPKTLRSKNCYFDENFVVTHFDDVEFVSWLRHNNMMTILNTCLLIDENVKNYYLDYDWSTHPYSLCIFVIESEKFTIKIHHASIQIDRITKDIPDSHQKWLEFNKPYFDLTVKRNFNRLGYDYSRWTQFGYPKYPVEHELNRFDEQYPNLLVSKDFLL